ncbi:hypothetical protein [Nitratifractor sp.]
MKILVLSRSRVVRELFRLAAKEEGMELESAEDLAELEGDRYDLVFVDSGLGLDPEAIREHLILGRLLGIRSPQEPELSGCDQELNKPFVPADILEILESYREGNPVTEREEPSLEEFLSEASEEGGEHASRVLDAGEIFRIKELLAAEEGNARKRSSKKGKKSRKSLSREEDQDAGKLEMEGEELLDLLERMKPKRLRKLLAGAEVTVTLRFPKESK